MSDDRRTRRTTKRSPSPRRRRSPGRNDAVEKASTPSSLPSMDKGMEMDSVDRLKQQMEGANAPDDLESRRLEIRALEERNKMLNSELELAKLQLAIQQNKSTSEMESNYTLGGYELKSKQKSVEKESQKPLALDGGDSSDGTDEESSIVKMKVQAIKTNGEPSGWKQFKFQVNAPMDSMKVTNWVKAVRSNKKRWNTAEYNDARKKYASRDKEWYKLLQSSACSKSSSSTMAMAQMNAANNGNVPWGHGALLYVHLEEMFENAKHTDPTFSKEAAVRFRASHMREKQTPLDWKEFLLTQWNDCKGQVDESEWVHHYIMHATDDYSSVKEKYANLDSGESWSVNDAFIRLNKFYNLILKKKEKTHTKKERKKAEKEKKKSDAAEAAQQLNLAVLRNQTSSNRPIFCFKCGELGHMKKDCKAKNPEKKCKVCGDAHWVFDCPVLGNYRSGKTKGKGKGKGKNANSEKGNRLNVADDHAQTEEKSNRESSSDDRDDYDQQSMSPFQWQMNRMDLALNDDQETMDSKTYLETSTAKSSSCNQYPQILQKVRQQERKRYDERVQRRLSQLKRSTQTTCNLTTSETKPEKDAVTIDSAKIEDVIDLKPNPRLMQRHRRYIGDIGVLVPSSSQSTSSIPSAKAESKNSLTVNNPGIIIEDDEFPDEPADTNKMLEGIMQSLETHPQILERFDRNEALQQSIDTHRQWKDIQTVNEHASNLNNEELTPRTNYNDVWGPHILGSNAAKVQAQIDRRWQETQDRLRAEKRNDLDRRWQQSLERPQSKQKDESYDNGDDSIMVLNTSINYDDSEESRPFHRFLHDSGCTYSAIDSKSPLIAYLNDYESATGTYDVAGGNKVGIIATARLPLRGYPNGWLPVKIVTGVDQDIFSATQAACDMFGYTLKRNPSGTLDAWVVNFNTDHRYPLHEDRKGGLLYLNVYPDSRHGISLTPPTSEALNLAKDASKSLSQTAKSVLWEARLAFPGETVMRKMADRPASGVQYHTLGRKSVTRNMAQQTISGPPTLLITDPKRQVKENTVEPYANFCMDVIDATIKSVRGYKYVLTIVEMKHRIKNTFNLLKKRHVYDACKTFYKIIVARFRVHVSRVHVDRGGEFMSNRLIKFLKEDIGVDEYTCSNTEKPWMNGIAENAEKQLQARARAMLIYAGLSANFWCYAIQHACYILNMLPSASMKWKSPLESRDQYIASCTNLRVFGCPAWIALRFKQRDNKWAQRSVEGMYVGYHIARKTHKIRTVCGRDIDTNDVEFNELFQDTYLPKGLMTTSDSYQKRNDDGTVNPVHMIESDDKELELDDDCEDDEAKFSEESTSDIEIDDVEFVVVGKTKKPKDLGPPVQDESSNVDPADNARAETKTRYGRKVKARDHFEPGHKTSKQQRKQQVEDQRKFHELWNERKKLNNHFRDLEKENGRFKKANAHFISVMKYANAAETEFINSASTRPNEAEQGSIEQKILKVKDPKHQKDIDRMDTWNQQRFNEATRVEFAKLLNPKVGKKIKLKDVPEDAEILETLCIWVTKFNQGKYSKTKARVVIRGDQAQKKDLSETFSPTVRFTSMLILFCLAAMYGWRIEKIDYICAFLNSDLKNPVYAKFPHGMREFDEDGDELCIQFLKASYGLQEAPKLWNETLDKQMKDLGYYQLRSDSCVHCQSFTNDGSKTNWVEATTKCNNDGKPTEGFNHQDFVILASHVDDIAIFSPSQKIGEREKTKLLTTYDATDEGLMTDFCGIRIDQNENGIYLDQEAYIDSLLGSYNVNVQDCKRSKCPISESVNVDDGQDPPDKNVQRKFWKLCGELMYLCTHTRPDISYAMNQLTRVAHKPHKKHLAQLFGLLLYCGHTKHYKMMFHRCKNIEVTGYNYMDSSNFEPVNFEGYADSSHADCKSTGKSSAGHCFFLGQKQAAIEVIAKMIPEVGNSSTENEYICLSRAAQSGFYSKQFIDELGVANESIKYVIFEDNKATLNALKRNVAQSKFRHLRTRWHYLRDLIKMKICSVRKVNTDDQIADMLTKPMFGQKLYTFTMQLLGNIPRDHHLGEELNMDYQPEMVQENGTVELTTKQAKNVRVLDIDSQ